MNKENNTKETTDKIKTENLKRLRLMLNMTQRQFLEEFLCDDNGELSMSVATYSNLESKGGIHLDRTIEATSDQLGLDPDIFTLEAKEFGDAVEAAASSNEKLNRCINGVKNSQNTISQLVNDLTLYFADEVMAGRLKRGDQIETDRELAAKMGVSRSSIREALKILNILGMIDIRMGQGMYLVGQESQVFSVPLSWSLFLDASQIDEILMIRDMLELKSVELAAECKDELLLAKLTSVFDKMYWSYKEHDLAAALDQDMEFHACIAECSGSKIILSMLHTIRNLMHRVSGSGLVDDVQLHDVYSEHRKIYGAIINQDKELAVSSMREHLVKSRGRYSFKAAEETLPI